MVHILSNIQQRNNLSPFSLLVHIERLLILHTQQQTSNMGHTLFWIHLLLSKERKKKYSKNLPMLMQQLVRQLQAMQQPIRPLVVKHIIRRGPIIQLAISSIRVKHMKS